MGSMAVQICQYSELESRIRRDLKNEAVRRIARQGTHGRGWPALSGGVSQWGAGGGAGAVAGVLVGFLRDGFGDGRGDSRTAPTSRTSQDSLTAGQTQPTSPSDQ